MEKNRQIITSDEEFELNQNLLKKNTIKPRLEDQLNDEKYHIAIPKSEKRNPVSPKVLANEDKCEDATKSIDTKFETENLGKIEEQKALKQLKKQQSLEEMKKKNLLRLEKRRKEVSATIARLQASTELKESTLALRERNTGLKVSH